jgi:hypothetical protein
MPYYEEGSVGYLILMSVTAIAGVPFTSVLIGIITSAIEERIGDLKKAGRLGVDGTHTVSQLRRSLANRGCVMLGYIGADKRSRYNLPLDETVTLSKDDDLIVLGRS